MESCPICNLQYKWNKKSNLELPNRHLAANSQHYCQQGKASKNLADERSHSQSDEKKV